MRKRLPAALCVFAAFLMVGLAEIGSAQTNSPPPCADSLSSCSDQGCSAPGILPPDPKLNVQKNRTGNLSQYRRFTFAEFVKLNDKAVNKKPRGHWTSQESTQVEGVENGAGAIVVAYLVDATLSDPETYNCYRPEPEGRDYHIWLGRSRHPAKGDYIVVEMTPRVRQAIQGWSLEKLRKLKKRAPKVRVKGFITFDDEHWNFPDKGIRATAWEIHPLTEFEICPPKTTCKADGDTGWVKLEQYQPK